MRSRCNNHCFYLVHSNFHMALTSSSHKHGYGPNWLRHHGGHSWHSGDNETDVWLQFVFNTPVHLNGFRTRAPAEKLGWAGGSFRSKSAKYFKIIKNVFYFRNYRFEVSSDDGQTWWTVHEGTGTNQTCCDWQHISFGSCVTARYFRLAMADNWGYEVEGSRYFVVKQLSFSYCAGEFI